MKRRDFLARGAVGACGLGAAGCSRLGTGSVNFKMRMAEKDYSTMIPKPVGTMPMGEIGATGIKVSKFGFGAHIRNDMIHDEKEREWMVREAFDLGVNFFDIYDMYSTNNNLNQYEPMGRYLAPFIDDVVISLIMWPYDGRNLEKELERMLRMYGRDYIDLVRIQAWNSADNEASLRRQNGHRWDWWETLFRFKEKGYIRAVGVPIHFRSDLEEPLASLPLDFVMLPFNFYHNWTWMSWKPDTFDSIIPKLREKGIGIVSIKPFAGDWLVDPLKDIATEFDESGEVHFTKACLRYVINADLKVDTTLGGMYNPYHVYENVDAYFNPSMSDEERDVLKKVRKRAKPLTKSLLPDHYRFLEDWVPDAWDDRDLNGIV